MMNPPTFTSVPNAEEAVGKRSFSFRYERELIRQKIKNRLSVFLDTMFWIDLQNEKDAMAVALRTKLKDAVQRKKIFCPLSFATILEMGKQNAESRIKTSTLMDELSCGAAFANSKDIFEWEVERYCNITVNKVFKEADVCFAYVPVVGYLSDKFKLIYDEFSADEREEVEHLNDAVLKKVSTMSLTELTKIRGDSVSEMLKKFSSPPDYKSRIRKVRELYKGDKKKMWLHEVATVFANSISGTMAKTVQGPMRTTFLNMIKEIKPDENDTRMTSALFSMPAIHNHIDLMAVIYQFPERVFSLNDFFDLEMAPVPLAYSDAFVTKDKWLNDIIERRSGMLRRTKCSLISGFEELSVWLDAYCA
jgi:hypothetical protein